MVCAKIRISGNTLVSHRRPRQNEFRGRRKRIARAHGARRRHIAHENLISSTGHDNRSERWAGRLAYAPTPVAIGPATRGGHVCVTNRTSVNGTRKRNRRGYVNPNCRTRVPTPVATPERRRRRDNQQQRPKCSAASSGRPRVDAPSPLGCLFVERWVRGGRIGGRSHGRNVARHGRNGRGRHELRKGRRQRRGWSCQWRRRERARRRG